MMLSLPSIKIYLGVCTFAHRCMISNLSVFDSHKHFLYSPETKAHASHFMHFATSQSYNFKTLIFFSLFLKVIDINIFPIINFFVSGYWMHHTRTCAGETESGPEGSVWHYAGMLAERASATVKHQRNLQDSSSPRKGLSNLFGHPGLTKAICEIVQSLVNLSFLISAFPRK